MGVVREITGDFSNFPELKRFLEPFRNLNENSLKTHSNSMFLNASS